MNKASIVGLVFGIFLFFNIAAFAGDLVKFPDGNAAWTVDVTYSGSFVASAAAVPASTPNAPVINRAQKIEVTLVDHVKRIRLTWSNGKITERWTFSKLPVIFMTDPRDESETVDLIPQASQDGLALEAGLHYDASAFSWLNPKFLQGKDPVSHLGKECFHYRGAVSYSIPGAEQETPPRPPTITVQEAWIDSKTLLPVELDTENTLNVFTFQKQPPPSSLVPPPNFKKEIDYYKRAIGYQG